MRLQLILDYLVAMLACLLSNIVVGLPFGVMHSTSLSYSLVPQGPPDGVEEANSRVRPRSRIRLDAIAVSTWRSLRPTSEDGATNPVLQSARA